jgi:hypothetical protein
LGGCTGGGYLLFDNESIMNCEEIPLPAPVVCGPFNNTDPVYQITGSNQALKWFWIHMGNNNHKAIERLKKKGSIEVVRVR